MPEQKRTASGVLGGFLGFIGLSVAAGILVTAAVTPALAVTGMTANSTIGVFNELPDYLKVGQSMEKTNIYATASDGSTPLLASFYDQNREEVTSDQVSQFAKDAAVAAEDPRFFEHGGVDMIGTARAIFKTYVVGGTTQGGSTITQQYVKNVLIQQCEVESPSQEALNACADEATKASGADGAARKLKEMRLAIGVEKDYSKDDILLGYLNIANFGARTYGIQAAAKYYFSVNAIDLNVEQAATLVAMVNNPNNLRIDKPANEINGAADGYSKTKIRRDYVLNDMLEHGKITAEQHAAAIAAPITPAITQPSTGCQTAGNSAYFCDYVTWIVKQDPAFGETPEARAAALRRGGLQIYTTLDLDIQAASQASIDASIPHTMARTNIGAAATTVQPGTGRVLAMAQNKTFSNDAALTATSSEYTSVNYNTDKAYGGSSGFQMGSTFKAFILLDWLKEGHSLNESVNGERRTFTKWKDSCTGNYTQAYNPKNYDGSSSGSITPIDATRRSVNTAFVAMAQKLDMCSIFKGADAMGVHRADGKPLEAYPGTLLGANEVSPLSVATGIAGIAASGLTCTPIAIDKVFGPDGAEIPAPKSTCTQAVTPEVANAATFAMETVFKAGGTAARAAVPGAPLMGKTGTADEARHSWVTGGTSEAITSLWIGNVSGTSNMYNVRVLKGQSGFSAKFGVFAGILKASIAKYGGEEFPNPSDSLIKSKRVAVPEVSGQSVEAASAILEKSGFAVQVGSPVDSTVGAGLVASTDPAAGTDVATGSTITLHPSTGVAPLKVPNVVQADPDAAKKTLEGVGYEVAAECEANPDAPPGKGVVSKQNPAADSTLAAGQTVTITVARQNCD